MEENKNTSNNLSRSNNDEIDLIELFSVLGNKINSFFGSVGNMILSITLYFYRLIYKWKIIIGLAIVIGGVIGYLSKNTSQYYSSKATVNSRFLKGVDFLTEVSELNSLCTDEGRTQLAKALNLPVEVVEDITGISAKGYFETYKYNLIMDEHLADSMLVASYDSERRFQIEVSSSVQSITKEELQKGFEYFFSQNRYIQKNLDVYKKNLELKSETLDREKKELLEFSQAYKSIIDTQTKLMQDGKKEANRSNVLLLSGDQQQDSYIKQSGDLAFEAMEKGKDTEEEIAKIRVDLSLLQPVEFVNRFSEFYTVSLSAKGKTALGMLIGILCSILFAILTDINSFLKSKAQLNK